MPYTHATFLVGCLALAGIFPLAGFWSKDAIVASLHDKAHLLAHSSEHHGEQHATVVVETEAPKSSVLKRKPAVVEKPSFLVKLDPAKAATYATIYQTLYYVALFTAFLTAFYTFRAFFMTFYGEEVVPHEAHHAQESPQSMTGPLLALAVCAALMGIVFIYNNAQENRFVDFLGYTPSLAAGAVLETREPGKFHLDVAFLSTVAAGVGILLAMYLYMGDRREAVAAQRVFDLQGVQHLTDVQWVARLKQYGWIANLEKSLRSVGLGFLVSLAGLFLGLLALIVAIPFTLGTFASPYRLSLGKFFFDELYGWFVVKPLEIAAEVMAWLDRYLVDGLVNFCGWIPPAVGSLFRSLQMGLVQFYALAMLLGVVVLLAAGMVWAAR